LSFDQWCAVNGFSLSTGRRIAKSEQSPRFIALSKRRLGITVAENKRWQAARPNGLEQAQQANG
jgi:hypothetical protein